MNNFIINAKNVLAATVGLLGVLILGVIGLISLFDGKAISDFCQHNFGME